MGIIFGICLILLCMSTFLLIINISMKMSKRFYKLIAMGLGTEYATQVFLTIGGTINYSYDRYHAAAGQLWRKLYVSPRC